MRYLNHISLLGEYKRLSALKPESGHSNIITQMALDLQKELKLNDFPISNQLYNYIDKAINSIIRDDVFIPR